MNEQLNEQGKFDTATAAVTGNFTLQANLPNGKTMNISGYIYDGESVGSLNDRIDALHDVLDRQRTRAEIPELEARRDQTIHALNQMKDVMAALEKKQLDGGKLSSQEKQQLENMRISIERAQTDIEKGEKSIAEGKLKAGIKD